MFTKESAIDYAKEYLNECKKSNIQIANAFLFGSYAFEKQWEHSDIDIAIISNTFGENPIENWRLIRNANIKFFCIEPHLFTLEDFNNDTPFVDEVKRTGISLRSRPVA